MTKQLTIAKTDRHDKFKKVVSTILPYMGDNVGNIILLQVLVTLKLEGLVGQELSPEDARLIKSIQEMVLSTPEKREEALIVAQKYLT